MQKSKSKSKKINLLLAILLVSMFVVIPNLLISIQSDFKILIDEKDPNEIVNTRLPQESSVYYGDTTGEAYAVYVSGDYAYVADGASGLAVIDISDPTNPGTPVYEATSGPAIDIYVSGDYAYVAAYGSGLAVIDISDPTNPGTPVYEGTTGWTCGVYVSGDYAYLADYDSGLAVIDISDPTNPGTPVYENTIGYAWRIYVNGNYAYVGDVSSGLAVIDISDPTNPGTPVYESTTGDANGVYVSGDYIYVADWGSGLAVIDISDPTNPGTPNYEDTTGSASSVYVSGDYAYLAVGFSGLAVIDISNPTNPGTPVYEDTTGNARGVYVSGNYAYVADGNSGLAVIDISVPINPEIPVYEDTSGSTRDIYVSGDYAYLTDQVSGLAVIDISDPTNPGTPIYEATTGSALGIYVSGDYAYVAAYDSGLAVIDISDPTNPGTPVYEDMTGFAMAIYVSGDYAYVADIAGLAVIDISDPTNPGTPVYRATTGVARGVYVSGDYAYVADGGGLAVIDISDPTNPGTPVYEATTGVTYDVYVSGDYAYIAADMSGLAVIDISDPTNPGTPVYEDLNAGEAYGVYVSGDYAYVADWSSGLVVIDISDPTNPESPIYETISGWPWDVYVSGDYAYMASGNSGLAVIQIRERYDMENPIISNAPSDFAVVEGYTGQSISWTATDANPDTYTIELQGTGIVAGPIVWTSGVAINYNIPTGFGVGLYVYTVSFTDDNGNFITDSVDFTVEDGTSPIIMVEPNGITVELGYTGQTLGWMAIDANPDTYTIELLGTGIVAGPTAWTSNIPIFYNIPDGFGVGSYIYRVNFTDDYSNFDTDSVSFTVEDTTNPIIVSAPSDFIVETGYTVQSLSWTASDTYPGNYTIELIGTGIVVTSTPWINNTPVVYNIPDGFGVGSYIYTITFTDYYGNFITDSVDFTVEDTINPVITLHHINFTAEAGYTGMSLPWRANDTSPDTYTIELLGTGIVAGPTTWTSGVTITYNIPDGFSVGSYIYTVNFTDLGGNFVTHSVNFTVEDTINPIITVSPNNFAVEEGYVGQSISWTATDANPDTYTIELQGTGIVAGPTIWTSGLAITYNIPDGFAPGVYTYNITFTDDGGNSISNTVTVTINSIDDETPGGGIPFGNFFLIFIGLSVFCLIFIIKRQIIRDSK